MKYFFDTEFHEYKRDGVNTIELISIGIVAEDGREYYAVANEFDVQAAIGNPWLHEHVINPILAGFASDRPDISPQTVFFAMGKSNSDIAREIVEFTGVTEYSTGETTEFYAYYADYDWVVFCWLFGRMIDLPDGFPMYCKDLKQMLDDVQDANALFVPGNDCTLKDHPDYPTQENEHNALDDAKWNLALYNFLSSL